MTLSAARFHRLTAPVFAAAGVIGAIVLSMSARPQQGAQEAQAVDAATSSAVTAAAIDALVVHQQAYALSAPAKSQTSGLRQPTTAVGLQKGAPSAAISATARATKVAVVGRSFSGTAAVQEVRLLDAVQQASASPDFKSLDGGVSHVAIDSVKINGRHAQVHAAATMWSSVAQQQPDGRWIVATPQNTLQVTLGLDPDADGRWKVSTFTWTFAPGSQP
jgi:hypothetical protein